MKIPGIPPLSYLSQTPSEETDFSKPLATTFPFASTFNLVERMKSMPNLALNHLDAWALKPADFPNPYFVRTYAVSQAAQFATLAHKGQVRKYGTNAPYMTHCLAVAQIVSQFDADDEMLITALVHDTVEDTAVTFKQIRDLFGSQVETYVRALTKASYTKTSITKDQELALVNKQLQAAPPKAATIKLADIGHNIGDMGSMIQHDPVKARHYLNGKKDQMRFLTHGNDKLFEFTTMILDKAEALFI